ncbi:MAG: site-specific integrase [Pseudomonadota bacterium]
MPFRKKGSKNWHFDFQVRGRRFSGSCGTADYEEAKDVEAQARVEAKAGATTQGSFTLSQALGTYWNDVCQFQSSASTAKSQAKAILSVLDKNLRIESLTNADIQRFVTRRRAKVTNGTVNRQLDMLDRALRHMQRVHNARLGDLDFKASKTKEARERIRELSQDEQSRLFDKLRPDLVPLVKFALMTGARKDTICGLRWDDVGEDRILFRLKDDKEGYFPINAELRALLSAVPRSNVMRARPFVFTYVSKKYDCERHPIPSSGGHIWKLWREALVAAEIQNFRFHDLRHTWATRMLRHTGNLKLVSRLLHHESIETTLRYAHVLDEDLSAAMQNFTLSPAKTPAVKRSHQ